MRCCQIQINVPNTISLARTGRTPVASVVVDLVAAVPVALAAIRLRASTSAVSEVAEVDSPASSKISLAAAVPAAARAVLVSGASEAELELAALVALAVSVEPMPVMAQVLTSVLAVATAAAAVSKVLEPTMAK